MQHCRFLKFCLRNPYPSVQFSRSVVSDSLRPHESQHGRPPCPSSTPRVYLSSCPSSRWCHPAISSSVVPFSSCPQSLPASGSFPMSQLFAWGGLTLTTQEMLVPGKSIFITPWGIYSYKKTILHYGKIVLVLKHTRDKWISLWAHSWRPCLS